MATKSTIVLCEDEIHWLFVRRWLLSKGLSSTELRLITLPAGKRAGSQHVMLNYAQEVREYRSKANHLSSRRLIVVIDADVSSVSERFQDFENKLNEAGIPARGAKERICILVPRRNCETWVHFFLGNQVDENTDYKHHYPNDLKANACKEAAERFRLWLSMPLDSADSSPASLLKSRDEAKRIADLCA